MKTSDFDYALAPEFIAQTPVEPRDASRLMVVHGTTGQIEHRVFRDIGEYLRPGDNDIVITCPVVNSQVNAFFTLHAGSDDGSADADMVIERVRELWNRHD